MNPCTVDGCDRPKVPGPGKKYCAECKATAHLRWKAPDPCSIEGCDRPMNARGWCHTHYEHNRKYGTPHSRTTRDRFDEKVDRNGPEFGDLGRCWLWIGGKLPAGYGTLWHSPEQGHGYAHRISYELHVGPIPDGLQIDHLCRRPSCVNPRHLEPVTAEENMRRQGAAITHCVNGHVYDEANTYRNPSTGLRSCRACGRQRAREILARRKETAA